MDIEVDISEYRSGGRSGHQSTLKRRLLVNFTRSSSLTGSGSRTIRLSSATRGSGATSFVNGKSRGLVGPATRLTSRLSASCQKPGLTPYFTGTDPLLYSYSYSCKHSGERSATSSR